MQRVKSVRKKTSEGTFGSAIPFGTDGILVDMLSGLDNEQELKIGGNHVSSIEEDGNNTTITEVFKDLTNTNILYTLITVITEINNTTTITMNLYSGEYEVGATPLRFKTITFSETAIDTTITEELVTGGEG